MASSSDISERKKHVKDVIAFKTQFQNHFSRKYIMTTFCVLLILHEYTYLLHFLNCGFNQV